MIREVRRHIEHALTRIRLPFRGRVSLVNAAPGMQLLQVKGVAGEVLQSMELMQHFGFTSNPPAETECVVLPLGGKTSHGIIIATEHGNLRLKNLASGEVALYNQWGDQIILKKNRRMQVISSVAVDINTPVTTMSGNLEVAGNIVAQGDISDHGNKSMAGMRTTHNGHTHNDPQGGSVGTPNGAM